MNIEQETSEQKSDRTWQCTHLKYILTLEYNEIELRVFMFLAITFFPVAYSSPREFSKI